MLLFLCLHLATCALRYPCIEHFQIYRCSLLYVLQVQHYYTRHLQKYALCKILLNVDQGCEMSYYYIYGPQFYAFYFYTIYIHYI